MYTKWFLQTFKSYANTCPVVFIRTRLETRENFICIHFKYFSMNDFKNKKNYQMFNILKVSPKTFLQKSYWKFFKKNQLVILKENWRQMIARLDIPKYFSRSSSRDYFFSWKPSIFFRTILKTFLDFFFDCGVVQDSWQNLGGFPGDFFLNVWTPCGNHEKT